MANRVTKSQSGSGGGAVSSVSNTDGTIAIAPTTGAVVVSLALGHANTWTGQQTFNTASAIFGVAPTFSTMTQNSVLYAGAGGVLSQDNTNFIYTTAGGLRIGPTSVGISSENKLSVIGNANDYHGTLVQNLNAGNVASTDMIVANDLNDGISYADFGVNSSVNTNPSYTGIGASDAYLFTSGNLNNLFIGTGTVGKVINFATGGYLTSNIRMSLSSTALSSNIQHNWNSGAGAMTHLLGPNDQTFTILGGTPIQTTTAQNGRAVTIAGGAAIAQSSGTSSATGGALNLLGGVGAPTSFGNGTGGAVNITGGAGTNSSGIGGNVNIQAGTASGTPGDVILLNDTSGIGNVRIRLNNVSTGTAGGFIVDATAPISGTTVASAPFITMTTGSAKNIAVGGTISNPGGAFTINTGAGGSNATATTAVGGAGGAFNINLGAGANATGAGTNTGGAGGSFTLTAGTGGSSSGGTTNNTGNGGTINFIAGNGGTTGVGGTSIGIGGDINLTAGNSVNITNSPRGGNVNITGGNTSNSGGSNAGGQVNITGGAPSIGTSGQINLKTVAGGAVQTASINLTTGTPTATANAGAINLTTGNGGFAGGNALAWSGGNMVFITGNGASSSATSGVAGNGGSYTFTTGNGANAAGATSTGGNGGKYTINLGTAGTGTSTNGTAGSFNIAFSASNVFSVDSTGAGILATSLRIGPTSAGISSENKLSVIGNANDYHGTFVQNLNAGTLASTDMVIANDLNDGVSHADFGVNSSVNSNPSYTGIAASDVYLFTAGNLNNLFIGTGSATKVINFATGGYLTSNIRATLSDTALASNVQHSWNTGLGAIKHILGPSDQAFAIASQSPVAALASQNGQNLNLTASNATAGTTTASVATGGSVNITAGMGATKINSGGNGGNVVITGGQGSGSGSASSGTVIIQGAPMNGLTPTGGVTIQTQSNAGGGGGVGAINITGAGSNTATNSGSSVSGGVVNITTGVGSYNTNGSYTGVGGALTVTLGAGGAPTNTSGITGSAGGVFTVTGGKGGNSTTGTGGANVAGAGSSFNLTTGNGGNASGGTSNTGGNGGNYAIVLGTAGTGSTANGTAGQFTMTQTLSGSDATAMMSLSPTWNTTGTPTAVRVNVTDTASNAASLLQDWQVGGTSKFKISKTGTITIVDGGNIAIGTSTGTQIGTTTLQKIGFWGATPIVQPTTAIIGAAYVSGAGTPLTTLDTFDGYTLAQAVKALRNEGLLA